LVGRGRDGGKRGRRACARARARRRGLERVVGGICERVDPGRRGRDTTDPPPERHDREDEGDEEATDAPDQHGGWGNMLAARYPERAPTARRLPSAGEYRCRCPFP